MKLDEIIKILCIKRNTTVAELSSKMGFSKQNLFNKLYRNDMKVSDFEKTLELLNAKIVIVDQESGNPIL
jgi:ribosomal protein S24E